MSEGDPAEPMQVITHHASSRSGDEKHHKLVSKVCARHLLQFLTFVELRLLGLYQRTAATPSETF